MGTGLLRGNCCCCNCVRVEGLLELTRLDKECCGILNAVIVCVVACLVGITKSGSVGGLDWLVGCSCIWPKVDGKALTFWS